MKLTEFEKQILERAFNHINDWSAWDDLEDLDFYDEIQPQILELAKKLGVDF